MTLSKSKNGSLSAAALTAAFAAAALSGCMGKDDPITDGGGGAARVYEAARFDGASARGPTAAYWTVDRIEDEADGGESVAVIENSETLLTEDRPLKDLPDGVGEGLMLTDGGTAGGAMRADAEGAAARAARIAERFERLKADGAAGVLR